MAALEPALACELLEPQALIVFYKGRTPARDEEWDAFLDQVQAALRYGERLRFFVWNEDGQMPRAHQTRLIEMVRGAHHRVAVISPSAMLRFVVSIFMLMNRHMRFFAPAQRSEAYAHLRCDPKERADVEAALGRLRARVDGVAQPNVASA